MYCVKLYFFVRCAKIYQFGFLSLFLVLFQKRGGGKVPPKVDGAITYGPWGGTGGSMFNDGTYTGIRQINLSRNVGIVSVKVCYDQDGKAVWGSKHGGTGGFRHDRVLYNQYKLHLS